MLPLGVIGLWQVLVVLAGLFFCGFFFYLFVRLILAVIRYLESRTNDY